MRAAQGAQGVSSQTELQTNSRSMLLLTERNINKLTKQVNALTNFMSLVALI